MIKPFTAKTIPKELKQLYENHKNDCIYVLERLEEIYDYEIIEDVNVLLFYSYFEIECALNVYVDDVLPTVEKVINRFKAVDKTVTVCSFLDSIKKIKSKAIRKRQKIERLMKLDFYSLDLEKKKEIVYELDNPSLEAEYFLNIYQETNDLHYFACHALNVYESGDKENAIEKYKEFMCSADIGVKEIFQVRVYQDFLDYYQNEKEMFRNVWDEAKSVCKEFPVTLNCFSGIMKSAYKHGFMDICLEVKALMLKNKIAIPEEIIKI